MSERFYCERCSHRQDLAGDCPHCEDEPLLDIEDPDVRLMLREMDAADIRRRNYSIGAVAAVVGILPVAALSIVIGEGKTLVLAWAGTSIALGWAGTRLFGIKARHPV